MATDKRSAKRRGSASPQLIRPRSVGLAAGLAWAALHAPHSVTAVSAGRWCLGALTIAVATRGGLDLALGILTWLAGFGRWSWRMTEAQRRRGDPEDSR